MTKQQRAQVVELLRCAADHDPGREGINGRVTAGRHLAVDFDSFASADAAVAAVGEAFASWESYQHALLEAAARIEEGSWP